MDLTDEPTLDVLSNDGQPQLPHSIPDSNPEIRWDDRFPDMRILTSLETPTSTHIPDLLRADLYVLDNVKLVSPTAMILTACRDQLYFDRVHTFVPILHQRRYFSWAKQPRKTESRQCLQYAMWTVAASLSAQLQHIRDSLYRDIRQMLESLELKDNNVEFTDIEHAQARLLLAIYEFMQMNYQRGWMSAGRCFRLVQLMRLYEIDGPDNVTRRQNSTKQEDWIKTEEKRRTFWMAYSLDRFISIRHEWPLTINEQVVSS